MATIYSKQDQIKHLEDSFVASCKNRLSKEVLVRSLKALQLAGSLSEEGSKNLLALENQSRALDLEIEKTKEVIEDVRTGKINAGGK